MTHSSESLYSKFFDYSSVQKQWDKIKKGIIEFKKRLETAPRDYRRPQYVNLRIEDFKEFITITVPFLRILAYTTCLMAKQKRFFRKLEITGPDAIADLYDLRAYSIKILLLFRFEPQKILITDNLMLTRFAHDLLLKDIINIQETLDGVKFLFDIIEVPIDTGKIYIIFSKATELKTIHRYMQKTRTRRRTRLKLEEDFEGEEEEEEEEEEEASEDEEELTLDQIINRIKLVYFDTPEGEALMERFNIKKLPAIVFPERNLVVQDVKGDFMIYIQSLMETTPFSILTKTTKIIERFRALFDEILRFFYFTVIPEVLKGKVNGTTLRDIYLYAKRVRKMMINLKRFVAMELPNFARRWPEVFCGFGVATEKAINLIQVWMQKQNEITSDWRYFIMHFFHLIVALTAVDGVLEFIKQEPGDISYDGDVIAIVYTPKCEKCNYVKERLSSIKSTDRFKIRWIKAHPLADLTPPLNFMMYTVEHEKSVTYGVPGAFWATRLEILSNPNITPQDFLKQLFGDYWGDIVRDSGIEVQSVTVLSAKDVTKKTRKSRKKGMANADLFTEEEIEQLEKEGKIMKTGIYKRPTPEAMAEKISTPPPNNLDLFMPGGFVAGQKMPKVEFKPDGIAVARWIREEIWKINDLDEFIYKLRTMNFTWKMIQMLVALKFGYFYSEANLRRRYKLYTKKMQSVQEQMVEGKKEE